MLFQQFEKQDKLVYGKRARIPAQKIFSKSKRKINPTINLPIDLNVYQRLDLQQQKNKNCKQNTQSKTLSKVIENQWIFNEFFIPNCDDNYYKKAPMKQLLQQTFKYSENKQIKIKFKFFKHLQRALPKPKLFNTYFIEDERKNIYYNRITKRSKIQNLKKDELNKLTKFKQSHSVMQVGSAVWVFRPICHHMHAGKILSSYKDSYLIKFNNTHLGSEKISQFCVSGIFMQTYTTYLTKNIYNQMYKTPKKTSQIDVQAFELYLYLLKLKQELIVKLRGFHNLAQKKLKRNSLLSKNQLQQYGWVGSVIVLISIATKWISNNYKVTYSKHPHQSHEKGQTLPKLALSETYTKSWISENQETIHKKQQYAEGNCNINASLYEGNQKTQKVQQIINDSQKQIEAQNASLITQKDITQTIDLSLYILASIKTKGKQFQNEASDYFLKLKSKFNDKFPNQINQIQTRLSNLHKKLTNQ